MYSINYIMHCKRHLNTAVEKQASKGSYTI